MKLGIGLPNTLVPQVNRKLMIDWARVADQAGFHVAGTIDQPGYDSWDPLITLAIAAGVTERMRLATTILQLPNRNEALVAKQTAVIDRVSGGRLDLGVAVGHRESDFKIFGARLAGRGKKMDRQLRKIRRMWRSAKRANDTQGQPGPAPIQKPLPPIYVGGYSDNAVKRAIEFGDGYVFGAAGAEFMASRIPELRRLAEEAGKKTFPIMAIAYVAVGNDARAALEEGEKNVTRYYGGSLPRPAADMIHHGPADVIAEAAKEYEQAGVDSLVLFPMIASIRQVEEIGENVLPSYRIPSH